ncbi:type II toxin-antitoxin system HicB family antitoxin [Anabaena sp. UHCC 0451]|uniref:type II toxin-antitoxin system HicB family antitoxin n=1 Tax=Anabaena sp. UHCC 0451 TaxID=2055235 RepID=UPI002B1F6283|nr:type II toxin-antitoxin system HicB family antitoxin [Anabaena sp. UHCC 0451]MEA5577864.1 type II toxin-antitoxin system HicB family antitoxin [Anabaena sp. UHCC 0451]
MKTMKSRSFTVIIYKEDDMYIAECPEVGTVDQGETIEQAITGLKEATQLYLEEFTFIPIKKPKYHFSTFKLDIKAEYLNREKIYEQ